MSHREGSPGPVQMLYTISFSFPTKFVGFFLGEAFIVKTLSVMIHCEPEDTLMLNCGAAEKLIMNRNIVNIQK